jgi:hypothetical protein
MLEKPNAVDYAYFLKQRKENHNEI